MNVIYTSCRIDMLYIYVKYIMNIMSIIKHEIILQVSGSSRDVTCLPVLVGFLGRLSIPNTLLGKKLVQSYKPSRPIGRFPYSQDQCDWPPKLRSFLEMGLRVKSSSLSQCEVFSFTSIL